MLILLAFFSISFDGLREHRWTPWLDKDRRSLRPSWGHPFRNKICRMKRFKLNWSSLLSDRSQNKDDRSPRFGNWSAEFLIDARSLSSALQLGKLTRLGINVWYTIYQNVLSYCPRSCSRVWMRCPQLGMFSSIMLHTLPHKSTYLYMKLAVRANDACTNMI